MENTQTNSNAANSNAIVSLILGILSLFIPMVGLILGVIGIIVSRKAVSQINQTNESGRGFATTGLVCSIVGVIFHLFVVLLFGAYMIV